VPPLQLAPPLVPRPLRRHRTKSQAASAAASSAITFRGQNQLQQFLWVLKYFADLSPCAPSTFDVNCAATFIPATELSSATNRISLMRMLGSPAIAVFKLFGK